MRRIRYAVAMSLDGYIAGSTGETGWIISDPGIDFAKLFSQFDTILVGRRTFEIMVNEGRATIPGMKTIVFSRTLSPQDYPAVTIVAEMQKEILATLKTEPGKDIWLFGGGLLFQSLAADGLVDTVEVSIIPVLLGAGFPLLPPPARHIKLALIAHKTCKTGIVSLEYAVR